MKKLILKSTVIGLFLLGSISFVLANDKDKEKSDCHPKEKKSYEEVLSKIDSNNDGKISLEESIKANEERFAKKDKNHDGFITKKEFKQDGPPKEKPSFEELLQKMDVNKDGLLARDEVKGPLSEQFNKVDANQDGFISKVELEKAPPPAKKDGNKPK